MGSFYCCKHKHRKSIRQCIDCAQDQSDILEKLTLYRSTLESAREALTIYANQTHWGNAGWEGHPDDVWRGPESKIRKPWSIAEDSLSQIQKVLGEK